MGVFQGLLPTPFLKQTMLPTVSLKIYNHSFFSHHFPVLRYQFSAPWSATPKVLILSMFMFHIHQKIWNFGQMHTAHSCNTHITHQQNTITIHNNSAITGLDFQKKRITFSTQHTWFQIYRCANSHKHLVTSSTKIIILNTYINTLKHKYNNTLTTYPQTILLWRILISTMYT